ncbi:hypothetical protein FM036_13940 [Nostoc sp. HG1]|nr:hypothetical protein [Nostoc sp. HG1]
MTQTIQAKVIDLRYLIDNFRIHLVLDNSFFSEWQGDLPEINDLDKQLLDTGSEFIFVKLVKGNPPRYALSKGFLMGNPGNELYDVLRILKHLTQLVSA